MDSSADKASGFAVDVAANLLQLLEAACGQGQAAGQAPDWDNSSAPPAGVLAAVLRRAVAYYKLSLAGPAPGLEYSSAALHPACEHVRQALQQSRLADFELASPSSPAAAAPKQAGHSSQTWPRTQSGKAPLKTDCCYHQKAINVAHPTDNDTEKCES